MPFIYWESNKDISLENYTLIIPAVSVGNVGQLAVDLLLSNLKTECIAYIHHPCFLPIVGADAFDPESQKLSTSCQMYECKKKKIVIIQHRAPLVKNKVKEYMNFLISFVKEHKIEKTVLLSSSFSEFFTYDQLQSVPLHYLYTGNFNEEIFQELNWKKFNLSIPHTSAIPGGGITKTFLDFCETENIPLFVLIMVCSEGDNYNEANLMIVNLDKWLNIRENDASSGRWKIPFSWSYPYANDPPRGMY